MPISSAFTLDQMFQRLLSIIEAQSQTIEAQDRRLSELEGRHADYVQALENIEAKLDYLNRTQPPVMETGQPVEDTEPSLEM
jgi:DNA repair exonuclease SbcCD ATPase subunit